MFPTRRLCRHHSTYGCDTIRALDNNVLLFQALKFTANSSTACFNGQWSMVRRNPCFLQTNVPVRQVSNLLLKMSKRLHCLTKF